MGRPWTPIWILGNDVHDIGSHVRLLLAYIYGLLAYKGVYWLF